MTAPICPHCQSPCRLTTGKEIYPTWPRLADKKIWTCTGAGCDARVGCHDGTETPLGTPANAELRNARKTLHNQRFDPIWKNSVKLYKPEDEKAVRKIQRAARNRTYAFLAERMGIPREECHTGMFDLDRCRDAWRALTNIDYTYIRDWWKAKPVAEQEAMYAEWTAQRDAAREARAQ